MVENPRVGVGRQNNALRRACYKALHAQVDHDHFHGFSVLFGPSSLPFIPSWFD